MSTKKSFQNLYLKIIDPTNKGILIGILRIILAPFAFLYGLLIRLRNHAYDRNWLSTHSCEIPVISVGNITAGGTGKTPFTAWLANFFQKNNIKTAILSRGYGSDPKTGIDDENQVLTDKLPGTPVIINADRTAGAKYAIEKHDPDILIMDDGFQHRRLERDLDIVLIDATLPFGHGHILPLGLLREHPTALSRADILVITRSDQIEDRDIHKLKARLKKLSDNKPIVLATHKPVSLDRLPIKKVKPSTTDISLEMLREGSWAACCAIGNPTAFQKTLEDLGCNLKIFKTFPDHHKYGEKDLREIREKALGKSCRGLLVTSKDAIKIKDFQHLVSPLPVYVLGVDMYLGEGKDQLLEKLQERTDRKLSDRR